MLGLLEFGCLSFDNDKLINFLIEHGVLANIIKCSNCSNDVNICKKTLTYRCDKRYYIKDAHKKRISKRCNFYQSARTGTWFSNSNLDVGTICRLVACFLMLQHPRQDRTQVETGIASPTTIVDWFNFCREVIMFHLYFVHDC